MTPAPLLTPAAVADVLGLRDRRTVRLRLAELDVPVIPLGRSYRVRSGDLERAIERAARIEGRPEPTIVRRQRRAPPARSGPPRPGWWREPTPGEVGSDSGG